jgi:hypothetical protein
MKLRVEEVLGKPKPVFSGKDTPRTSILARFLPCTVETVLNLLQEINRVEVGPDSVAYFERGIIDGEIHRDRIIIDYLGADKASDCGRVEIPLEEAKLMLFEWGTALQRWRIKKRKRPVNKNYSS